MADGHTPCVPSRAMNRSKGWNPWHALRDRPHLRLVHAPLRPPARGGLVPLGDGTAIVVLHDELGRIDRNAVLAHELVHDERGIFAPPDAPQALCAKEEAIVTQETARRLVPLDELAAYIRVCVDAGEPVHAGLVAAEFDVPLDVAYVAMQLLVKGGWQWACSER